VGDPDPELLAQALRLDAQARDAGEATAEGRELLEQAAQRRVAALGTRSYPVLVCRECLRLTGWTGAGGRCDPCLRRAQLQAAYSDPHGGFVALDDRRTAHPEPAAKHHLFGRDRARVGAWLARVEPDETGPVSPEPGWELEGAERDEVEAVDGSGMVVRFWTARHRFDGDGWLELDGTLIGRADLPFPSEQSAGLPAEQLVDAWLDYKAGVQAFNARAWSAESARRETARLAQEAHDDTIRDQRAALDLLDET
jgi:hypothetical protein